MDAAPMQESLQTFQAAPGTPAPRFRPYASALHHVTKGRYITSNDPRGYIPVYEYPLNNQWIMMDIDDGYILWTGIWKALGNSKADIVRMIDSQPDLANVIRRVRGGYLKIQGTWMPYDVALNLARRVAWNIRDDLVPLFGPAFPSTCLSPDQPGYGQVVPSASGRRRARRNNLLQPLVAAQDASDNKNSNRGSYRHNQPAPLVPGPVPPVSALSTFPPQQSQRDRHRYAPYPSSPATDMPPPPRRSSTSSRGSLDIPALALRATSSTSPLSTSPAAAPIHLPAIHGNGASSDAVYALPPISALEDLRGIHKHDAAAVLRHLTSDDDEGPRRPERRAFSVPAPRNPSPFPPSAHRRSIGQTPTPGLRLRVPSHATLAESDTSGSAPSSPASPATPRSAVSGLGMGMPRDQQLVLVPLAVLKEQSRFAAPHAYSLPAAFGKSTWIGDELACRRRDSSDSYSCASPLSSW